MGVLLGDTDIESVIIARCMSWAAYRQTSRVEDMAYSLLVIFGVNMTLLYGEGAKSFLRLQEELCKQDTDLSLFAWTTPGKRQEYRGIFARSPSEFRECRFLKRAPAQTPYEFTTSNRGLRIDGLRLHLTQSNLLIMDVNTSDTRNQKCLAICLAKTAHGYVRSFPQLLLALEEQHASFPPIIFPGSLKPPLYIARHLTRLGSDAVIGQRQEILAIRMHYRWKVDVIAAEPVDRWDPTSIAFLLGKGYFLCAVALRFSLPDNPTRDYVIVASISHSEPFANHPHALNFAWCQQSSEEFGVVMANINAQSFSTVEGSNDVTKALLSSTGVIHEAPASVPLSDSVMTGSIQGGVDRNPRGPYYAIDLRLNYIFDSISEGEA